MASAEAILKKRMPEKVGILPVAELLFVAESMWVGEHDMKGHFHPSFRFVKAKRYNAKPHVLIMKLFTSRESTQSLWCGFQCVQRQPCRTVSSKLDRNGIAWCYLIDYELGRIPDFTEGKQVTPVICLETGKRFETQSQAEIELGISRGSICRALNTGKTAKGYHWIRESEYSEEKAAAARAESAPYRVVCLETGTRYKTYADAGRDLGVEEGNIQQAVKSKSHYARGYHFVNSDEYSTLAKGEIENILKWDGRSRTVVCVETGKRYESIKAAVAEYGDRQESARSGIGLCCKNPYRTFGGKHWCYPDDLESRIDNAEEYTVPRKTAVRCLETGKMYESIADASRDTGINNNSIRSVARGDRHKAGGYTWEYVNPAPDKRDNRGRNQPTAKKVRCAETGNQFVSLSDAARAVGLRNGNSIRRAIDRGGTAGGYHWEYLDEKKR